MKKFFTLLMLLSLGSTLAHATDYGLTIAGKAITSTGDIDAGQSKGTINWDGKRLTLTDVKVNYTSTGSGSFIFYSGTEDLSISFIGDNTISSSRHIIRSTSSAAISIWGERNKTGRLTLTINDDAGDGFCPVWVDGNLRIGCLYLTVRGKDYAITGNGSNTFSLDETVLDAKTTGSHSPNSDFASANFNYYDAYLTTGHYDTTKKDVCDDNGNVLKQVETETGLIVGKAIVASGWDFDMAVNPQGLNSGSIKFNWATRTLTLDAIDMKGADYAIINRRYNGLKIVVKGANTIDAGTHWGIFSNKSVTLQGYNADYTKDRLTVSNAYGPLCLWLPSGGSDATMTLKDLTLDLKGTSNATYCTAGQGLSGSLAIENCKLTTEVTDSESKFGGIHGFTTCTLTGCGVNTYYTPAFFNSSQKSFTNISGTPLKKVLIDVPTTTYSGITVLGTPVTNLNYTKILVDGLTQGAISYNNDDHRLTLNGVTLTAPEGNTAAGIKIASYIDTEILIKGNNYVTTIGNTLETRSSAIVTMTGSGKFIGESTTAIGLSMYNQSSFVVDVDGTVSLKGQDTGIYGDGSTYDASTVTLKKKSNSSDYYFQGITDGAITNISNLKLEGMDFYYSENYGTPGCYFDNKSVLQNGGKRVKGDDVVNFYNIDTTYPLTIAGTPVTNCNRRAIGSKYITAGGPHALSYDHDSYTLTLDSATINYNGSNQSISVIKNNGVDGLNIKLKGNNTIKTTGYAAIENSGTQEQYITTRITGDDTLTAKSSWYALWTDIFSAFDIGGNAEVTAEGETVGIGGNMSGVCGEALTVRDNARVKARGNRNAVERLGKIELLDGQRILQPAGAEPIKDPNWGWFIGVDGARIAEWVVIGKAIKGDVNGDGSVDVADIGCIIDVMAGMGDEKLKAAADVNGDTSVDVADIGEVIDIMAASARKVKSEE